MGIDESDLAFEAYGADLAADAEYEYWESHFTGAITDQVKSSVVSAHEEAAKQIPGELTYAKKGLERGDFDGLIIASLRSYRAIDFYGNAMNHAIIRSVLEPFETFIDEKLVSEGKLRKIFQEQFLHAMRDRVLDEVYRSQEPRKMLITFFRTFSMKRNEIVHGLLEPTADDAAAMFEAAKAFFELADRSLNPSAPIKLAPRF